MDKTELLSKYLFDIHCKQLTPYYDGDDSLSWEDLVEKSNIKNDIDKTFFRNISKDIISKLKTESNFGTLLPQLLYEIHASSLPPYYMSLDDYSVYHTDRSQNNWTTLKENTSDRDQVDKQFFRDMAKFIIDTLTTDA